MAKKQQHTSGPWKHYHNKLRPQFATIIHEIHGPNGERVVTWGGFDGCDLPNQQVTANARLIAAAPELLVAAQTVLEGLNARIDQASQAGKPVPLFDGIAGLYAAIAKALGEE